MANEKLLLSPVTTFTKQEGPTGERLTMKLQKTIQMNCTLEKAVPVTKFICLLAAESSAWEKTI